MEVPECGKSISDKADICIHCGYPLGNNEPQVEAVLTDEFIYDPHRYSTDTETYIECKQCGRISHFSNDNFQTINFRAYVITNKELICKYCNKTIPQNSKIVSELMQQGGMTRVQQVEEEYRQAMNRVSSLQNTVPKPSLPTCPRCGSTSITTGARGVSGFWGFIGASKTVNRCANCGHTWTPRG